MDNSLLINFYIQEILEDSTEVTAIIGEDVHNIFTLQQPKEITFPFIVHSRTGVQTSYTKDIEYTNAGWYNTIQYTVKCVSDDYMQSLELANAVRHSLETYRLHNEEITIHPIQLIAAAEYTIDDGFVQQLDFQMVVE